MACNLGFGNNIKVFAKNVAKNSNIRTLQLSSSLLCDIHGEKITEMIKFMADSRDNMVWVEGLRCKVDDHDAHEHENPHPDPLHDLININISNHKQK